MGYIKDKIIIDFVKESTGNKITITDALEYPANYFKCNGREYAIIFSNNKLAKDCDMMKFVTLITNIINDDINRERTPIDKNYIKNDVYADYYMRVSAGNNAVMGVVYVWNHLTDVGISFRSIYNLCKSELLSDMKIDCEL